MTPDPLQRYRAIVAGPLPLCALLLAAVAVLYWPFLASPLVFDDKPLFAALDRWLAPSALNLRFLPHASLAWTQKLFGADLVPYRMGNLLLHAANAVVLFLFLRRLFLLVLNPTGTSSSYYTRIAFIGALLFALHPVAVYATAYLVQRSVLLATLFSLLMWLAYTEGLARHQQRWLLVSAGFYYLAVFSKEASIMAPAVALCLTALLRTPSPSLVRTLAPTFVLYAVIAVLAVLRSGNIIGTPYEPMAKAMLVDVDPAWAVGLSAINQSFLFFKYLLLWLVPYPGWMAVDMREPFPQSLLSLPPAAGPVAFAGFATLGLWLLRKRDRPAARLAGLALLAPTLLFLTEFSTVRVQEPFVLYRSYLWFGLALAALPAITHRLSAKKTYAALAVVGVCLVPASRDRLVTFSDPLPLWDDAVSLVSAKPGVPGADRIYYNRGNAFLMRRQTKQAAEDYTKAIELNPKNQGAYSNRGYIHYLNGRYREAVDDYAKAVAIDPRSRRPYFGLGMGYRALGQEKLARDYWRESCDRGYQPACLALRARPTR